MSDSKENQIDVQEQIEKLDSPDLKKRVQAINALLRQSDDRAVMPILNLMRTERDPLVLNTLGLILDATVKQCVDMAKWNADIVRKIKEAAGR